MPYGVSTMPLPTATIDGGHALGRFSAVVLFLTLALGLVLPKIAGAGFLLLALVAMVWLTWNRAWHLQGLHASERLLVLAALLFVGVWLLAWVWHGLDADGRQGLGRILRLLLIVPLFLYLRRIDGLAAAWWHGLAAGALIAGAHAWWFLLSGQIGEFEDRAGGATNPIYFGGIALLMAFMLLARISQPGLAAWARIVAAAGVFGGVSASLLSGSRGAWVAAIPLLLLYLLSFGRHLGTAWRIGLPTVFLATAIGLNLLPQINMDQRLADVAREIGASMSGQPSGGGVAERIEMWRISLAEIGKRPLLGPGPGAFKQALVEAVEDGRASAELLVYRHPHSQFLSAWLHGGIPGLVSLVLLFGLPLRRFWLMRSSSLDSTQTMAWCALAAIGMLAVMALTESIFERNIGVIWFALLLAGSLGLLTSERRRELAAPVQRQARLSVIVIVYNEADRIRHCLDPISGWADEIVILDSGSTDDTVAICREYTDRVEQTDWPGFGPQKQRALDRATGDWVLSLDADEVVGTELKREIDFTLAQEPPRHQAYTLPWLTHAFGTTLQHGHWARAPLRLFRRDCGRFTPAAVHEKVVLADGCKTGHLQAPLHHFSYRDSAHARAKLAGYARLQAQERFEAGRRCRWPALAWIKAALNWIDNYLLRAAFLDGRGGWIMSRLTAAYTLEKYRALARLGRG
ncbi:MAG: glycosyltransferase [Wenzhouxiangella sp.]|nr:MAG: glycosyltransferase [Wenzhouxiangella sp.]